MGGFTYGVSSLELAGAYTPFANGGFYSLPSCITRIDDGRGETVYRRPETKVCVLSGETAFLMTSMLKSAATTGTARNVQVGGVEIAAKTGTSGGDTLTGSNRDAWTVAYNPDYTMGCWMGFDTTDEIHSLPSQVTGGTYPAHLIRKLFQDIYKDKQAPVFTQPENILAVKIDIHTLKEGDKPMLASAFTPDEQTAIEYFVDKFAPDEFSTYWSVPEPPENLAVIQGDGGFPRISFKPVQQHAIYRLMRRDIIKGVPVMIGEYTGLTGALAINDMTAEYGCTYEYYVVPVHPEIKIKGEQLCGPPSKGVRIMMLPEEDYVP